MQNPPAELVAFQARMKRNTSFVPFVKHAAMPTAQPIRGFASPTLEQAEERVRECLANTVFTAGYVVCATFISEVAR